MQPAPAQNQIPPKKSKVIFTKMVSISLGIAGVMAIMSIIGLGALLAGHVWNPKWNPFPQTSNSDKVMRDKIFQQMKK